MPVDLILPLSMVLSFIAWSLIVCWYVHPFLRWYPVEKALEPLLLLHSFRYVGLMFLVPGVTSEVLDSRFSHPAAYGDLVAAVLALVAIAAIRLRAGWALAVVWVFNVWGMADLVNAVVRGIAFTPDGHLGAAYWIPATLVPPLLVTHVYIFGLLIDRVRRRRRAAA